MSIIGQGRTQKVKEGSDMAKDITVHKSFSLIEKFSENDSLTTNEKMLLKYLPHKVQNIIWELHSSMMFPIPYCFSAIMTAVSGSIANSKALCTQNGYIVYPSIFMAIIGESGENKSQPIKWFMRPLWTRTAEMLKDYNGELDAYLKEVAKGNFEMDKPKKVQFIIQDATIEAIKEILYENPRGLLVIFDELISWIKSFSRYKRGKASEEGEWIVICDGDSLMVNRKGDARVLYIKHPFVALIGSIQPYVLCDAFKGSGMEDGLLWRIFMTYSEHPASPILWNDNKPDENLQDQWSEIITAILDQSFDADYDCPKALRYTDNAWTVIRSWQNMKEEDYTANHSQKELSVWRKVQVSVHKISICLKELWKACGEDVLEIGEGDNGDLPTDDDPLGNENFIGMQMALAAIQVMDYYLENALHTLKMMTDMFPGVLTQGQKLFLKMFPLEEFVSRSAIVDHAVKRGMKQRTIDRYLSQLRGTMLECNHGKYRLTESGKMAIYGGNR